ncbi:unnamed protein product [marine sediment metagenome]|uniref:Uncharacterized protein n=1 Tax=marine sediment metagenome TaxID=412755 RepID=X1KL35_9ZZZZ
MESDVRARNIGNFLRAVPSYIDGNDGMGLYWLATESGFNFKALRFDLLNAGLIDINDRPNDGVTGQDIINAISLF